MTGKFQIILNLFESWTYWIFMKFLIGILIVLLFTS